MVGPDWDRVPHSVRLASTSDETGGNYRTAQPWRLRALPTNVFMFAVSD